MACTKSMCWRLVALMAIGVSFTGRIAASEEEEVEQSGLPYTVVEAEEDMVDEGKMPAFWIGISGESMNETLQRQLGLETGVVVLGVMDGSPAAEAGLQQHDIVVAVDSEPVSRIQDFFAPVGNSKGAPLKVSIVRQGEHREITVAPQPRPRALERRPGDQRPGRRERMWFVNPGQMHDLDIWLSDRNDNAVGRLLENAQEGVRITIRKEGKAPARIEVRRDGESWEVTEDEIDQLPEDLRAMVKVPKAESTFRWHQLLPGIDEEIELDHDASGLADLISKGRSGRIGKRLERRQQRVETADERRQSRDKAVESRLDELAEMLKALKDDVEQLKAD